MNPISSTRAALGLSQAEFGVWLAEQSGRGAPYSRQRICDWEHGRKSPRRNIRDICAPVAAIACAKDILQSVNMDDAPKVVVGRVATIIASCQR